MSALPGPNNPIVYAQFRLQGGWRGVILIAGILLAILGAVLALNAAAAVAAGRTASAIVAGWPQGLVILQLMFLLVVAPLQVMSAIRRDVTSQMIESHRLMPVSAGATVIGYVVGGPWASLVLAGTTLAFGTLCGVIGGGDPSDFLIANAVLLAMAAMLCVVTAHLTLVSRLGILLLLVVIPVGLTGDGGPSELLPGCSVLTAPLLSHSALILRSAGGGRNGLGAFTAELWAYSLFGLAAIAAISSRAAARLYRLPGTVGLTPALGLLLLCVWVGLSAAGLSRPDLFGPAHNYRSSMGPAVQMVASVSAALLIAAMPIAAAVKGVASTHQGSRRAWMPVAVTVAAIVFVLALPALTLQAWPPKDTDLPRHAARRAAMLVTMGVVGASLASFAFLFGLAYRRVSRAWPFTFGWLVLLWVAPLIIDAATSVSTDAGFGPIATLSPIGALAVSWTWTDSAPPHPPFKGVAAQWVIAGVTGALLAVSLLRRRAAAADQGRVVGMTQPGELESKMVGSRGLTVAGNGTAREGDET